MGLPGGPVVKIFIYTCQIYIPVNAGDTRNLGSIPESNPRSGTSPRVGNGHIQCSY